MSEDRELYEESRIVSDYWKEAARVVYRSSSKEIHEAPILTLPPIGAIEAQIKALWQKIEELLKELENYENV